ncbi:MAG: MaoC family dehydratase N-terminal domain-containing protein [Candidatus Nanopelagicales bacterium]
MTLNAELVGRTYPPTAAYVVGREKVREFAAAIGDANPAYTDVAAAQALGYADVIAPPTFAFVVSYAGSALAAADPELGLDYSRVVHGEQRFTYTRPIVAGDALVAKATIEAIRAVAGNDILTTRVDLETEAGEPVVSTTTVIVARGTAEGDS